VLEVWPSISECRAEGTCRKLVDHYPIITQLSIQTSIVMTKMRPNFRLADWPKVTTSLKNNLNNLPTPTEITDTQHFDKTLKELNKAIQDAIDKHIPKSKPFPYSKRWWTTELVNEKKKMQQLGGQAKYHQMNENHPIHKKYCQQ
jgi:hypothetical protein